MELTGGQGADITVEAAGYRDCLEATLRLVRNLGKVIIFGIQENASEDRVPLDTSLFLRNAPTIIPDAGRDQRRPDHAHRDDDRAKGARLVGPGRDGDAPNEVRRRAEGL